MIFADAASRKQTPLLSPQSSALSPQPSAWSLRLLLAALLAFCSEVVVFTALTRQSVVELGLAALGYVALSALLLDTAARFRLRDAFGLLALAGSYGMLNGLLINPATTLSDVPRTLITRGMGAHAVAGLLALALLLVIGRGGLWSRRKLIIMLVLALVTGFGWGAWAKWWRFVVGTGAISELIDLIIPAAGGFALIAAALVLANRRRSETPVDMRLNPAGWAFTLIILGGLLIIRLVRGEVDILSLSMIVTLAVFSVMILWFQQRKKGAILLDGLGAGATHWLGIAALMMAFVAAGIAGYGLPRGDTAGDPIAIISAVFTAYGLIWLPAISIVLGARAFSRRARAMNL